MNSEKALKPFPTVKTDEEAERPAQDRRAVLKTLLAAPMTAPMLLASAVRAETAATPDLALAAATMGLISATVCTVLPETTEGPYYLDPRLLRRNIAEDKAGIPLRMQMQVVTADCRPVAKARVDIWQCDAQGDYSGYANMGAGRENDTTGQTFLRGTQMTDDNGVVTFETIYPGWYRGRTAHLHYKVFLDERTVLTSQIFFPDALSEYVYLNHPAYKRTDARDTVNNIDGIAAQAGEGAYCAIREQKGRYIAALVVGIDPHAEWQEGGQGMAGGPPPMDGQPQGAGMPPGPPPEGAPGGLGPVGQRTNSTTLFPDGAIPD